MLRFDRMIRSSMTVGQVKLQFPQMASIFEGYGFRDVCDGCSIEAVARRQGLSPFEVVNGLNRIATSSNADTRHRAMAAAEGAGAKLDQVASWILDLDQATTCDERHEAIGHLAATPDSRSLPALRKAKAQKCVEKEASSAIQRITTAKPPHPRLRPISRPSRSINAS